MVSSEWEYDGRMPWQEVIRKARRGDPDAAFMMGSAYMDGLVDTQGNSIVKRNPRRAVDWLQHAAEKGCVDAQANLGYCYDVGLGVSQDKNAAMKWYKKAYKAGSGEAANNIATLYEERRDSRRAYFWHVKAAESGNAESLVSVGRCLLLGIGVRANRDSAVRYLTKAMESASISSGAYSEAEELMLEHQ